ncbi:uncharacterized protein ACR2FA_009476 isoform 2-T3 [Aphomia sociella]
MELQAVLVLCGIGVIVVAVLLLMGLFSASGTSYEEAIAQQRRATTELLALAENKNKPKKSNKKANKKLAKKEKNKESAGLATGSELESEAPAESGVDDDVVPAAKPHVDFSPPVVVDVPRDALPNIKIRKRGKDPKVKPILLNKEDPSCISDPNLVPSPTANTVSNHFEEMHPKDEFELLQSSLAAEKLPEKKEEIVEKKENKAPKVVKGSKAAKPSLLAEPAKDEVARERHNSGDAPKEQRKGKKVDKKTSDEVVEVVREEVVPPLNAPQPSELTTEKLLKQALAPVVAQPAASSPPAGKNKKKKPEPNIVTLMAGDGSAGINVGELVRVVREAPLSRTEIQILTDALLNKHHDLLPEHSEWTEGPNDPIQKLKKQLADKEKALADEVEASQALHAKLKELRTTLNTERGRAAAASRATEQSAAAARAELHTLQARLQRLHDEHCALQQDKLMLQSKLAADAEAQAQRVQMEMHIQRLTDNEAQLVSQLSALQAEAGVLARELSQARCDAAGVRDALLHAQQHHADLAQQLQEANRLCEEYAERLNQQELKSSQERHIATTELQAEIQRLTARAQAAENNAEKQKEETEKQKQQLSNELASLKEQLTTREAELAELKQMKVVPAQNGLPPSNAGDQHKAAELAKVESVVESLRSELANAQSSSKEQREQLARLQEQLAQYQQKNNEAISKAQETQYNEVVNVLRAACPVAAPNTAAGRDWLQTFANNLKKELEKKETEKKLLEKKTTVPQTTAAPATDARVKDLTAQNEQLQSVIDNYKKIIDDTEGVLDKLQQNVASEERRWAEQLAEKDRYIEELRQRTVMQMQNKIDSLQAELQQAKAAKHSNHTFADSERHAEERLMAGLSDKFAVDVRNGPLQVGLEEK